MVMQDSLFSKIVHMRLCTAIQDLGPYDTSGLQGQYTDGSHQQVAPSLFEAMAVNQELNESVAALQEAVALLRQ